MKLIQLRIDEAVLPFMNDDSLCDIPSFVKNVDYIEYTYKNQVGFRHIKSDATQRDLAGVSLVKGVLKSIWLKWQYF